MPETLVDGLMLIQYGCVAAELVLVPFLVVYSVRFVYSPRGPDGKRLRAAAPPGLALLFLIVIFVGSSAYVIVAFHGRSETLKFLETLPPAHLVLVDGRQVDAPAPLLADLESVRFGLGHHSHPTISFSIEVQSSSQVLRLILRRDSTTPSEYWVYYPTDRGPAAIGRLSTHALDAY